MAANRMRNKSRGLAALAEFEGRLVEGLPSTQSMGFREFVESPDFCNTRLSPLIAAVIDASEGRRPTTITEEQCQKHFGCGLDGLPGKKVRTVDVCAGGRAGKTSRMLAPKALHAAWTVPLPTLAPGEFASYLIIAPQMKLARQTLSFIVGYVSQSPTLRRALLSEPTKEHVELRRPDGKLVRIEIVAASTRGTTSRSRTLCGAGLEEACFFYDEITGAVNDTEVYTSVIQRVVPEGQVWVISTPWLAKVGLLEAHMEEDFGLHEHHLCVRGDTRAFNPSWDPDGTIEAEMRAEDPDKARREIDGEPMEGTAATFFDLSLIDKAVNSTLVCPRKAKPGEEVTAGADFGFRSDSSAMCVVHRDSEKYYVADLLELRPEGAPLKPSDTVRKFGTRLRSGDNTDLEYVVADSHYRETITEHLAEFGLGFKEAPLDVPVTYLRARALFREGRVVLPANPRLLKQLRSVQWRPNPGGSISIVLPREKTGGHCDLVAALILALWESSGLPVPLPKPEVGSEAYYKLQEAEIVAQLEDKLADRKREGEAWWSKSVGDGGVL